MPRPTTEAAADTAITDSRSTAARRSSASHRHHRYFAAEPGGPGATESPGPGRRVCEAVGRRSAPGVNVRAGCTAWRPSDGPGSSRRSRIHSAGGCWRMGLEREPLMPETEPTAQLNEVFSQPGATASPWAEAARVLSAAEMFWLSTVRRDGRPHVTPLPAIWADGDAALLRRLPRAESQEHGVRSPLRPNHRHHPAPLGARRRGRGNRRPGDQYQTAGTAGGDVEVQA